MIPPFLLSFLAVSIGLASLPRGMTWKSVFGLGALAGIGFTMSIFITLLAFDNDVLIDNAKLVIMISSLVAGIIGLLLVFLSVRKLTPVTDNEVNEAPNAPEVRRA